MDRLFRGGRPATAGANGEPVTASDLTDGALDTLSTVLRVMGDESFPLENDIDAAVFPTVCREFSCHVENGAAVPSHDIPPSDSGARQWAHVRRFFADRRKAEKAFVTGRLQDYRGVVEDLVAGLRSIGERDQVTESDVRECLEQIEDAVSTGVLPEIREALTRTVQRVNDTFAEQKRQYEAQLAELNDRMSNLRQDLVAAREEMKRDALTDAYNRGAFDAAIAQSLNMHFILNQPVTLILIDLDNFKTINDSCGHAAGDEVLRSVGECLARSFIRKNDFVARYGGDEFAVILNDTSADNAHQVVNRFIAGIEDVKVPYADGERSVTCSAGYTEIHASDTIESLIQRADRGLYKAKGAGRNQAVYEPWQGD
ncbi:MAG: GGDEF domain-containing protein [Woeseiaceae bacterium]|nr:GGDEF domain-containing protein [Woeseiaceae bacterium]